MRIAMLCLLLVLSTVADTCGSDAIMGFRDTKPETIKAADRARRGISSSTTSTTSDDPGMLDTSTPTSDFLTLEDGATQKEVVEKIDGAYIYCKSGKIKKGNMRQVTIIGSDLKVEVLFSSGGIHPTIKITREKEKGK